MPPSEKPATPQKDLEARLIVKNGARKQGIKSYLLKQNQKRNETTQNKGAEDPAAKTGQIEWCGLPKAAQSIFGEKEVDLIN